MKIQIVVKMGVSSKMESNSKLDLIVGAADTVSSVKERVKDVQLIPFPIQDLKMNGEVLAEEQTLVDCGVKELTSLDIVVNASEKVLVQQLSDLLQARDLSSDELSLLYCYKNGVSVTQALKIIGQEEISLLDFLKGQKIFQVENNNVALVREGTKLKPFSVSEEVETILNANGGTMDVKELCSKFAEKFNVSLSSIAGKPTEFLQREKSLFSVKIGGGRPSVTSLSAKPKQPPPANQQLDGCANNIDASELTELPPGLEAGPPRKVVAFEEGSADCQQYLDLHQQISGRVNARTTQALAELEEVLCETSFLNIDHIVKGGSVGNGTAISGLTDAQIVLFLKGLPPAGHESLLPPLLKAVAGVLVERIGQEKELGIEDIRTTEDSVQLRVKGLVVVDIRFSPVFDTFANTIVALGKLGPDVRRFYIASLVEQRTQFIARQTSQVKITIRLLKWWRDQQNWSSKLVRPTDEILELIPVYSAVQTKPADQRKAIANVMSLLSRFNELRIVWSNYYNKGDVWSPLLRQKPLLMDPVNPFVNVADPQAFDARELMTLARTTHFFW